LVLKQDGTVVAWGGNWSGQNTVPSDLSDVIAIAAGGGQSLAIVLSKVSDGDQAFFLHPRRTASGSFLITLTGAPGHSYLIQVSPDLRNWSDFESVTLNGAQMEFEDQEGSGDNRRFYRAVKVDAQ
jgi:hypothetical protein